jgi:hypothetical protein
MKRRKCNVASKAYQRKRIAENISWQLGGKISAVIGCQQYQRQRLM